MRMGGNPECMLLLLWQTSMGGDAIEVHPAPKPESRTRGDKVCGEQAVGWVR